MKQLLTTLFLLITLAASAQKKGTITGVLKDSTDTKKMIGYATVSVYKAADTILTGYRLSDDKGQFKLVGLDAGKYRLVITAWQYSTKRLTVDVTADRPDLDLKEIMLSPAENMLDQIDVVAERPPVIVRKDTIEFNAESFKTLPTAVVEDLLRKLPGVRVGENGQIEVNGKAVSKILVDGKEFFGGDQQIATKNLPANIIDKVQINDDDEAKRRDPDLIPANTPQVINLKLKRAIKQGAFGKLYAGGGMKEFYEAGGIMSFFRDTTQLSMLAYGNNVNKPGFTLSDVSRIGGFERSGYNSMMVTSDGGFALDDISFGGITSGVQKTYGGGFNFNTLTKGGVKINGRYFYGHNDDITRQQINENQAFDTQRLITGTSQYSLGNTGSHNISAKIEWKFDSLTNFYVRPYATLRPHRFRNETTKLTTDETATQVNSALINSSRERSNNDYGLSLYMSKDFKKRGRTFNAQANVNRTETSADEFNYSDLIVYNPAQSIVTDQLRANDLRNFNLNGNLNYTEPLTKKLALTLGFGATYIDNENALNTFFKDPANQYTIIQPSLTETVAQSGLKTSSRVSLRWSVTPNFSVTPALVYNTIDLENAFTNYNNFSQKFDFLFPSLAMRYKAFSLSYTPSFSEPDVQFIQPVANNTDPLFVQRGNTSLVPSKVQRLNLNFFKYDPKNSVNYSINANGAIRDNAVALERTIQMNGAQVTVPVNVNGLKNLGSSASISKDFKKTGRQITLSGGFFVNYTEDIIIANDLRVSSFINSRSYTTAFTPRGTIRLNLNDKLELGQSYNVTFSNTTFESDFAARNMRTQNSETELVLRYLKHFVFESTFRLQVNGQNLPGYDNNLKLWNAGVTYLFMKNDRAQLKFSVNDILQSNVRRYVFVDRNIIRDTQTNNLGRYALMTLTYNIQNFGGKVGGKDRFLGF